MLPLHIALKRRHQLPCAVLQMLIEANPEALFSCLCDKDHSQACERKWELLNALTAHLAYHGIYSTLHCDGSAAEFISARHAVVGGKSTVWQSVGDSNPQCEPACVQSLVELLNRMHVRFLNQTHVVNLRDSEYREGLLDSLNLRRSDRNKREIEMRQTAYAQELPDEIVFSYEDMWRKYMVYEER